LSDDGPGYAAIEGIRVLNEAAGLTGVALEYSYGTLFAYRVLKCPDRVLVLLPDGSRVWWGLADCRPADP
jgi:hypothetical protein